MSKSYTLTAADIGTRSAKILVGQKELGSENINILAKHSIDYVVGVRKGEVYDSKKVVENISLLKEQTENESEINIEEVFSSVGGPHLFSKESEGLISVSRADNKISQKDVERALKASQTINLPPNKEILEVYPRKFVLDNNEEVEDPLDWEAVRLEAQTLLICIFSPVLEHLKDSFDHSDMKLKGTVPSPLAVGEAVLTEEQKELGVGLVDIGAGTTSVSVFSQGKLVDFDVFPIGSANITNDIAINLRVDISTAEKIKREYAEYKSKSKKKKIKLEDQDLSLSKKRLDKIVDSRVSEIFKEVKKKLKDISQDTILPGGVVFTGGGAKLEGLTEEGKDYFDLPCYFSGPKNLTAVRAAEFSNCAGVLLNQFKKLEQGKETSKGGIGKAVKKIFQTFSP